MTYEHWKWCEHCTHPKSTCKICEVKDKCTKHCPACIEAETTKRVAGDIHNMIFDAMPAYKITAFDLIKRIHGWLDEIDARYLGVK